MPSDRRAEGLWRQTGANYRAKPWYELLGQVAYQIGLDWNSSPTRPRVISTRWNDLLDPT